MSTLVTERDVFAESVSFSEDALTVRLDDGRWLSALWRGIRGYCTEPRRNEQTTSCSARGRASTGPNLTRTSASRGSWPDDGQPSPRRPWRIGCREGNSLPGAAPARRYNANIRDFGSLVPGSSPGRVILLPYGRLAGGVETHRSAVSVRRALTSPAAIARLIGLPP